MLSESVRDVASDVSVITNDDNEGSIHSPAIIYFFS